MIPTPRQIFLACLFGGIVGGITTALVPMAIKKLTDVKAPEAK